MKIALVDDNPLNRSSFLQKMQPFSDVEITIIATNGHEFLEKLKGLPHSSLPVVVFMDIQMPGLSGIETIKLSKPIFEFIHFIVLTIFEDDETIFEAIQAGASGYLLKHESATTIYESLHEVMEYGGAPMSPAIARKTLKLLGQKSSEYNATTSTLLETLLTEREREVLLQLVNGYDAKRISELVDCSTLTVRKHIANIYNKLHVNSKAQVISLAHKNNWV